MRKLEERMKTLGTASSLSSPTLLQFIWVPERWQMTTMPLNRYTPIEGKNGKLDDFSIGRTTEHCTSLPLDTSHAIPPRVLCFGPSRRPRPPPVRPVHPTGQTGQVHRSDRFGAVIDPPSLRTWLSAQPRNLQWFCGEPLVKPRRRHSTSMPSFKPQVFRFHRTDRLLELALFLDLVAAIIPAR